MINTGKLAGKTLFITGASRGIGKAIALKAAKDGANIVIAAKTTEPHPKLPGTIYTTAKELEQEGGKCLPCIVDVRDEEQVKNAVETAVQKFGGIDILVNNASAIHLTGTVETPMKRYDLMHNINTRGTFLASKYCVPFLKKAENPHILNISPPLNMSPRWFKDHVAYTMAKYGMSMCVLGMAEEFKADGIAVNAIWPKTAIHTAAMEMLGGKDVAKSCRKPEIVADASYVILSKDSSFTGNFCIDEDVLKEAGITDLEQYSYEPGSSLMTDFFLDDNVETQASASSPNTAGNSVEKVFTTIKTMMTAELANSLKGLFVFRIKGATEEEVWFIDTQTETPNIAKGDPPSSSPNLVFITDSDTFVKIAKGETKPASAFMSGKLSLQGKLTEARKLENLFGNLRSSKL